MPPGAPGAPGRRRRAVIVIAYLASAMTFIEGTTVATMVVPIQRDFGLSVDEANNLQLLPEMAGLLIVFAAAALAVRLGQRTVLLAAASAFAAGSLLISVAPNPGILMLAQTLVGMGTVTLAVLGLSLINTTFSDGAARGRAFGVLAALAPVVSLVMPNLSAIICDTVGWRVVPFLWTALAAVLLVLTFVWAPGRTERPNGGEMITPLLAGLALASLCLAFTTLSAPSVVTGVALITSVAAALAVAFVMSRRQSPGLDLRTLRTRTGKVAAAVLILLWSVNLIFYINLFLQFRYDYGVVTATLALTLCEVAAVAGGFFFGSLSSRLGSVRAGTIALACASVLGLGLVVVSVVPSPWLVIVVAMLINFPTVGAIGPITQNFLNQAPEDGSEGASSMADALSNIGFVAGGALISVVVFAGFSSSLSTGLQDRGYAATTAESIATEIRGGVNSREIVARDEPTDPRIRDALTEDSGAVAQAQTFALGIFGWAFALTLGAAALLMLPEWRRRELADRPGPPPDR